MYSNNHYLVKTYSEPITSFVITAHKCIHEITLFSDDAARLYAGHTWGKTIFTTYFIGRLGVCGICLVSVCDLSWLIFLYHSFSARVTLLLTPIASVANIHSNSMRGAGHTNRKRQMWNVSTPAFENVLSNPLFFHPECLTGHLCGWRHTHHVEQGRGEVGEDAIAHGVLIVIIGHVDSVDQVRGVRGVW